jgi:hypothetical protein
MSTIYQSNFLDTPINLDELLQYNKDGFEKTHLVLKITARDEQGAETEKEEEIPLFMIAGLAKSGNNFTWKFKSYSKIPINMQIEIINEARDVIVRGQEFTKGFTVNEYTFNDKLPNIEYKDDQYYYRLRVWVPIEAVDEYLPTRRGVLFELEKPYRSLKETTIDGDIRFIHKFLMDRLENVTLVDPNYVKKLINIICNPVNNKVFKLTSGTKGRYLRTIRHDPYGEEASFGINDDKVQFTVDDANRFISDKHMLNSYINGKRVFRRDNNTQIKNDGISRSYLKDGDVPDNANVELESMRSHLIDSERLIVKHLIQTEEEVQQLYSEGITMRASNIGSYLSHRDLSVYVRFKNSNSWKRVNPVRTKIGVNFSNNKRFSVTVRIKDSFIPKIGNELMVVSNNITDAMYFKTDAFNQLANYYQVPCYFVPVTHVTESGEVITEFMSDIENTEVYVNGYRLVPNEDFALINVMLHGQIPSMLLFKDMTHFGSKIEVVYLDHRKNTYFFISELENRTDKRGIITLKHDSPPFIEGTFTIFANNKKLNSSQYQIINSRSIVLKGSVATRKNFMIKFHHDNDELLIRLLELYKANPPLEDRQAQSIGQWNFVENWLKKNSTEVLADTDKDSYVGLKYVYQLNEKYNYFEQMYDMIKGGIAPDLDANNNNLFTDLKESPVIMDFLKKLPLYFNHDISVNCNRSFNEHRWEDNVALFNPGRAYLIHTTVDRHFDKLMDCDFDCNVLDSVEFLTYLNENIPLILPYLNNNILIDCNESQSKDNYKGLK